MNCSECGSEMWDNREGKKNPKAPDYKCKANPEHVIWPPRNKTNGTPKVTNVGTSPQRTSSTSDEIIRQSLLKVAATSFSGMGVDAAELIKYAESLNKYVKEGYSPVSPKLEESLEKAKASVLSANNPTEDVDEGDLPF